MKLRILIYAITWFITSLISILVWNPPFWACLLLGFNSGIMAWLIDMHINEED